MDADGRFLSRAWIIKCMIPNSLGRWMSSTRPDRNANSGGPVGDVGPEPKQELQDTGAEEEREWVIGRMYGGV